MALRYRVDLNGAAVSARMEAAARGAVESAGREILARARGMAPVRTGALAGSARLETNGLTARVSFNTPYAAWQHFVGSGPYLASAVTAAGAGRLLTEPLKGAL